MTGLEFDAVLAGNSQVTASQRELVMDILLNRVRIVETQYGVAIDVRSGVEFDPMDILGLPEVGE